MNPLEYINKLFCTLLVFCAGTKTYPQREIHPLELMFTYDYALKYYGNITTVGTSSMASYWFIENFKAPVGIKSIEHFSDYYNDFHVIKQSIIAQSILNMFIFMIRKRVF